MATETLEELEERVQRLESTLQVVQAQLAQQGPSPRRGWRWFVGIDADNSHFEEPVRLGHEWRSHDRPAEEQD